MRETIKLFSLICGLLAALPVYAADISTARELLQLELGGDVPGTTTTPPTSTTTNTTDATPSSTTNPSNR